MDKQVDMETNAEEGPSSHVIGDKKEATIEETCNAIQRVVMNLTRNANGLPVTDFPYYNTFPSFSKMVKNHRNQLLQTMTMLGKNCSNVGSFSKAHGDRAKFDMLCDVNDILLDRVGNSLDDAEGIKKKNEALVVATLKTQSSTATTSSNSKKYHLLGSKIVERPQVSFPDKIDNSHQPFVPRLKDKPNSLKPLAILPETTATGRQTFCHPYEFEIEKFVPSADVMVDVEPVKYTDFEETSFIMVEKPKDLRDMVSVLKKEKEIAVDLENHSYRTFQGFVCLIQISTRTTDYIVDALKLRGSLEVLNEVFTDPKILKVFHGAESDIVWLQRDFGVYVVNMFDTFYASKTLSLARHGLSHLMKTYCNIEVDKQFQLADWRIRPLPDEMLKYARMDTHYLLYIYDRMRNDLIRKGNESFNLLTSVYSKSSQTCLKKYEKPLQEEDGHLRILSKSNLVLNSRQLFALQQIYDWRDTLARDEDESTGYVLPNHMLLQMAQILPREIQGIIASCNPVPPLVKQNLHQLHLIILKAREQSLESVREDKKRRSLMPQQHLSLELDSQTKHDVCLVEPEFDHPLLDTMDCHQSRSVSHSKSQKQSSLFKFLTRKPSTAKEVTLDIIAPFDRYILALKKKPVMTEVTPTEVPMEVKHKRKLEDDEKEDGEVDSDVEMKISSELSKIRQQSQEEGTPESSKKKTKYEKQREKRWAKKRAEIAPHEYCQADLDALKVDTSGSKSNFNKKHKNKKKLSKEEQKEYRKEKRQNEEGNNIADRFRRGDMSLTFASK